MITSFAFPNKTKPCIACQLLPKKDSASPIRAERQWRDVTTCITKNVLNEVLFSSSLVSHSDHWHFLFIAIPQTLKMPSCSYVFFQPPFNYGTAVKMSTNTEFPGRTLNWERGGWHSSTVDPSNQKTDGSQYWDFAPGITWLGQQIKPPMHNCCQHSSYSLYNYMCTCVLTSKFFCYPEQYQMDEEGAHAMQRPKIACSKSVSNWYGVQEINVVSCWFKSYQIYVIHLLFVDCYHYHCWLLPMCGEHWPSAQRVWLPLWS